MSEETSVIRELQEIRQSIAVLDSKLSDTQRSLQNEIHTIRAEIHTIRAEILEFQLKSQQLEDIHTWTTRFREKITLSDVEKLREDVLQLKEFKAKSTVVFAVVQFAMAAIVTYLTK